MEIFIIAALSADGLIAPFRSNKASTHWTSSEDTKWFNQKTTEAGVVIMGRSTWDSIPTFYKPLKNRLNIIYTTSPSSIPDSWELDHQSNLPKSISQPITTKLPPKDVIKLLSQKPAHAPSQLKTQSIAIIGGTSIYTLFMLAKVVTTLYVTYEPIVFGQGKPLFDKPVGCQLHLDQVKSLSSQSKVFKYSIIYQKNNSHLS